MSSNRTTCACEAPPQPYVRFLEHVRATAATAQLHRRDEEEPRGDDVTRDIGARHDTLRKSQVDTFMFLPDPRPDPERLHRRAQDVGDDDEEGYYDDDNSQWVRPRLMHNSLLFWIASIRSPHITTLLPAPDVDRCVRELKTRVADEALRSRDVLCAVTNKNRKIANLESVLNTIEADDWDVEMPAWLPSLVMRVTGTHACVLDETHPCRRLDVCVTSPPPPPLVLCLFRAHGTKQFFARRSSRHRGRDGYLMPWHHAHAALQRLHLQRAFRDPPHAEDLGRFDVTQLRSLATHLGISSSGKKRTMLLREITEVMFSTPAAATATSGTGVGDGFVTVFSIMDGT